VSHQTSELGGAFTKGRIAKRLLDHPATDRGSTGRSFSPYMLSLIAAIPRVTTTMRLNYLPAIHLR
jgi:hypothetical protein